MLNPFLNRNQNVALPKLQIQNNEIEPKPININVTPKNSSLINNQRLIPNRKPKDTRIGEQQESRNLVRAIPKMIPLGPLKAGQLKLGPLKAKPQNAIGILAKNNAPIVTENNINRIINETYNKEQKLPKLIVKSSSISIYSWEEMQKITNIKINVNSLEGHGSVKDPRMGIEDPRYFCDFCSKKDCPGHYGLIEFHKPIYNPIFMRTIISVLQCVCNSCGKLLISKDKLIEKDLLRKNHSERLKLIAELCKDSSCINVSSNENSEPHYKNPIFITTSNVIECGEIKYIPSNKSSNDAKPQIMKIEKVQMILNSINDEDSQWIGFDRKNHPRNMIMNGMLVPPNIVRPTMYVGGIKNEDPLTISLKNIVQLVNNEASGVVPRKQRKVYDCDENQFFVNIHKLFFPKVDINKKNQETTSIISRIQGKGAIIRDMLMGKRNDFCGRTVIGPEATIKFLEIRIPKEFANILTKKVKVTDHNYDFIMKLAAEDKIVSYNPAGTNFRYTYRSDRPYTFKVGDTIERKLIDGDRIFDNRQPTLHRQSMMAYKVVLSDQKNIGLHLSYTTPMNADFDGDENNIWIPQNVEVEAEAEFIMNVIHNIMSSEHNRPIMGLVMNSITGVYLISRPEIRITDALFNELMSIVGPESKKTLYYRLRKYGVHPRSGRAAFSALLPPDFYYRNGKITIIEGILVDGQLRKSNVGTSNTSIIQRIHKKYGPYRTAQFFSEAPILINRWLIEHGFSVGFKDIVNFKKDPVTGKEYDENHMEVKKVLAEVFTQIEALGGPIKDRLEEQYRQKQIGSILNITRSVGLDLANKVLSGDNSIGIMTENGAGTKGSNSNLCQILASVGQQYLKGEILKPTITNGRRLLPAFEIDDLNPVANGFIPESYSMGLKPEGLFFLQAGGREGLIDTALNVSETGTIQRKMIKAFENFVIGYDGSIRNTIGTLFSTTYNSGYDISETIDINHNKNSMFINLESTINELNSKRGWFNRETYDRISKNRNEFENYPENILDINARPDYKIHDKKYNMNEPVPEIQTPNKITKFEKARIIGTRAKQIEENAPLLVDPGNEYDPVNIASMEYEKGILPIFVIRKLNDKTNKIIYPTLDNI